MSNNNKDNAIEKSTPKSIQSEENLETLTVPVVPKTEIIATEGSDIIPNVMGKVDQLEQIKQSIADNKGQVLAAMLQDIPSPVTRPIDMGEFCSLFGLHYQPDKSISGTLAEMLAPLSKWLGLFGYSYRNVYEAVSKVNTPENFDSQLNQLADKIAARPENEGFRKLFS
jgi:hypothetical protein